MEEARNKYLWLFFGILLVAASFAYLLNMINTQPLSKPVPAPLNTENSSHYVIRNQSGDIILETGWPVEVNDEYIDDDNTHYIIAKVENNKAWAQVKNEYQSSLPASPIAIPASAGNDLTLEMMKTALAEKKVALYCTHNDESYILTSMTATQEPDGDIIKVAENLQKNLIGFGVTTELNKNNHLPHDINAYNRSRRTAVQLLKQYPDALFDIHRDSAPAQSYLTTVNNIETSRVMMVIGRSNPNMQANLKFAQWIKSTADDLYPGLIRGIYMGAGVYNQDLTPRAILFEIGTDQVSLNIASKAALCLSDVLAHILARI